MVAYQPPDRVLATIGASYRSAPLLEAAERFIPLVKKDQPKLARFGISKDAAEILDEQIEEIEGLLRDARAKKNDTHLQMLEVAETMARARAWLKTLRMLASVNLALDAPSMNRVASPEPELIEIYPRDVLEELEHRLKGATDLHQRTRDGGLTRGFLSRGRKYAKKLRTAVGEHDVDPSNIAVMLRRLYIRKAQIYMRLKRIHRAAQLAFMDEPKRAAKYHLDEIEPKFVEPAFQ